MNQPSLAVYLFGHSLNKIVYPFIPSIRSALDLTASINGEPLVYFCECDSDDGTEDTVRRHFPTEIVLGHLRILHHSWGTHHTIQAYICNHILDEIGTSADYALKLDADEVLHEDSFGDFLEDLKYMWTFGVLLGRPRYTHFSPDFDTTWPFIYDSKSVISKTDSELRFDTNVRGDGCAIGGAREYQTRLEVQHFGKVSQGREKESLLKERTFQQMYLELGFPDPKVEAQTEQGYLDYLRVFDLDYKAGKFKKFTGTHPVYAKGWIEQMKLRSAEFWKERA